MTAGHFIFVPAVLLIGIIIGWALGSRAAKDAYAAELRKLEARRTNQPGQTQPNLIEPEPTWPNPTKPDRT